jgi:DNA-binding transcriptional MerR regulator
VYTIGEVAKMFNIPASTLRYYDKMGLFPNLNKAIANIRQFSDADIATIETIECLKDAGLQIAEIKDYIQLCAKGNSTLEKRLELFEVSQQKVKVQIKGLQNTLNMLKIKAYYYKLSIERGGEEFVDVSDAESLPANLKEVFDRYMNK